LELRIEKSPSWRRVLPFGALAMLLLLLVQFLAGMFVNLFVGIPTHPGTSGPPIGGAVQGVAWAITSGAPALAFHTALGLLLFVGSVGLVVVAIVSGRRRAVVVTTALGLLGLLGAAVNGVAFLNYSMDRATYLMSVGFSVAVAAYVVTLFLAREPLVHRLETASRPTAGG
jgi:hypothetical protein